MDLFALSDHWLYINFGIPLLICLARVCDVTLSTIRIIFVSKGERFIAPVLGFVEILIWLVAITQVMQHLDHWQNYIAYALGFALGNFFGIVIENRIALGHVMVTIITKTDAKKLIKILRDSGYWVTEADAIGNDGAVSLMVTIIKRKEISAIIPIIKENNPWAVYTFSDIRYVNQKMANVPVVYNLESKDSIKDERILEKN